MKKSINAVLTREQWLTNAVVEMEPLFTRAGYTIPAVRVSCGFPYASKKALGQCWDKSAASDKVAQLFVAPQVKDELAPQGVLSILVHEVVHGVVGNDQGHNGVFGKCARAVGLEGKLTQTVASAALIEEMKGWMEKLGEYPHAMLNPGGRPTKKQTTRMVKCECETCGYVARTSAKWLDVGAPVCPCNMQPMSFKAPEGEDDGGEE
jgi:hypothetical protein